MYNRDESIVSPSKPREDKPGEEVTLSDLDRIIKEAQERRGQKKKEFEFIAKLDKKEVSKYVLGGNPETIPHILRKELPKTLEERYASPVKYTKENEPEKTNWKTLPDRRVNIVELNKYIEKVKDDFYEPISTARIKELHDQLKKGKAKYSLADIREDDAKLSEKYHREYSSLLKDQLRQEAERRRRHKYLLEMHEMRMLLGQKVDINHPQLWKKEPIEAGEAKRVREVFEMKLRAQNDKSLQFSIDYETDISRKVEVYLNSKYKDVVVDKEITTILKERQEAEANKEKISEKIKTK